MLRKYLNPFAAAAGNFHCVPSRGENRVGAFRALGWIGQRNTLRFDPIAEESEFAGHLRRACSP